MAIEIREHPCNLDLCWDPAKPLNVVLVQPRYEVEAGGPSLGLIKATSRPGQEALICAVGEFIRLRNQRVPSADYDAVHAIVLPEFAVPRHEVCELLNAVAEADHGLLLVAGIERQTVGEYTHLLDGLSTVAEWRHQEKALLPAPNGAQDRWVNAMLIAWKAKDDSLSVFFQRKITPSASEVASLSSGTAVHVLRINGVRIAFSICSDMLNKDGSCPLVETLVQHFRGQDRPPLHAMVHIQYNPGPDHHLMQAGFQKLLVDSASQAGNLFVDTMVIRANVASSCEEEGSYGRSGVAVGAHRRDPGPPDCCHVHGDPLRCYDLRPRRAAAFLLQTQLPAWTHPPSAAAGARPVVKGLWLGIKKPDTTIDFRDAAAACPESYRFAAWRAFRSACDDILTPPKKNTRRAELGTYLARRYKELRADVWRPNGYCLERWGRHVFEWDRIRAPKPDDWTERDIGQLRRLVRSLAVLHAGVGLQPIAAGIGGTTIKFASGVHSLHSRVADFAFADVDERVAEEFREGTVGAVIGDVYLVSDATGASPEAKSVPVGGLAAADAPTAVQAVGEHSVMHACVTLLPVEAVERRVFSEAAIGPDDLPALIEAVLTTEEAEQEGG